jgi:hypothetical protein
MKAHLQKGQANVTYTSKTFTSNILTSSNATSNVQGKDFTIDELLDDEDH